MPLWQVVDVQNKQDEPDVLKLKFQAQIRGHEANDKAGRIQAGSSRVIACAQFTKKDSPILVFPDSQWSENYLSEFAIAG